MKYKTKIKIGISLLIALLFIVPSGSIMAGSPEADVKNTRSITFSDEDLMKRLPGDGPISQQPCPILPNGIFDPDFGDLYGDIPEGTYDLWTMLFLPEDCGPGAAKVFLEVYRKCCGGDYGEEIIMYETSFEDNFDIYNNWIQIDGDCGVIGGQYDSFDHTDARASDGDYSMKCSMYDIYKGNQDDFLQCTKSFDVSEQTAINVTFDIFVDGSGERDYVYGNYRVFDYLEFQVSDHILAPLDMWFNPDWMGFNGLAMEHPPAAFHDDEMFFTGMGPWGIFLEGSYFFFDTRIDPYQYWSYRDYTPKVKSIGGGWWHVWWQIDVQELEDFGFDITDMMFRFAWHSDPENQFEGAYVDNFKIVSLEGCEEKIFQTHTQGPIYWEQVPEDHTIYVDFPLDWDAVDLGLCKKTCYDFKLWVEAVEGDYFTDFDWPNVVDIPICVGDFYDCGILDVEVETSFGGETILPGLGVVEQGEDLHVTTWVHLQGTVPATDVPVKFTAFKKQWETVYETDFESGSAGWEFGHFGDFNSQWHVTDYDSWSGTKALGCFDEDTKYYKNNIDVDYALHGQSYDVRDYLELEYEYFVKYITEYAGDRWAIMLYDAATNFVLGNIGGVGFPTYGYQPEWIGPDQPAGKYANFDIMDAYEYWHDVRGMYHNPDGSSAYELGIGVAFWESDSSINEHPSAETDDPPNYWSGLYFDDIAVKGLTIGAEIYSDIIIIPEMEPCEVYEVQFEWEDVPYSNYLLRVECEPEGGCDNWPDKIPWEGQVLVVSNKENLHPKEVESIDYTDYGGGEWVISSSDTDNYIATNPGVLYPAYSDTVLMFCPDHGGECTTDPGDACCIDISAQLAAGEPVEFDFDAWWEVEGWPFDWVDLLIAPGCPADKITDWYYLDSWDDWSHPATSYYYTGWPNEDTSDGWVTMSAINGFPYDISGFCTAMGVTSFVLKFRFTCDSGWNYRGMKLDDFVMTNLILEGYPPEFEDFEDPADNMDNWCTMNMNTGQYWFHKFDKTGLPDDIGTYCNFYDYNDDGDFTGDSFVPLMNDGLIWTTEVEDCYEAFLALEVNYQFGLGSRGYIEIDDGSSSWWLLDFFDEGTASAGWENRQYDISFLAGNPIQIRFRVVTDADYGWDAEDHYCIRNAHITGKQDHTAPASTITMTGTMKDSGWYNTAVKVKITAEDDVAMGEIHYILDGAETVVAGNIAEFTVSGNGQHTLEFWAVDSMGNAEGHHIIPPFRIDSGSAPTVAITAPEPGLYLFGNKILSASKVIIIGAFTIEATASDAESGIYKVQFYLDGDVIAEDTELPFSAYCAVKHMGEGTIKVVAEDFAQNTAEDTLDITYYKFL